MTTAKKRQISFLIRPLLAWKTQIRGVAVVLQNIILSATMLSEEELSQDLLEIITVFSTRLYGARSHKNTKLVEAAKVLAE